MTATVPAAGKRAAHQPPDPYRWLEDDTSPETQEWTARQEAAYLRAVRGWSQRAAFATVLEELSERFARHGTPRPAGGRLFFTDRPRGAEHPRLAVAEPAGDVRVLLDPVLLDADGGVTIEHWEVSPDGRLLAYQVAAAGTEDSSLHVLDVGSGALVDGPIDRMRRSSVAWLPDASAFYYVRRLDPALIPGEEQYHRRVRFHRVGGDPEADPLVFGEGRGRTQHYAVGVSADGRWLSVSAGAGTDRVRELWLADLAAGPLEQPRLEQVALPRPARSHLLIPASAGGIGAAATAYLSTDLDAPRGRLVAADPAAPSAERWRTLVAEDPDSVLEDFVLLTCGAFDDRPVLVVSRTRHAVGEAALHDAVDGRCISTLPLPPGGTVGPLRAAPDGGHEAWFSHASFTEPPVVYRYDLHANSTTSWPGPGRGLDPAGEAPEQDLPSAPLETRQLTATSQDGTTVRMFVIARPDVFAAAGRRPVPALLTAYGGFGQSSVPSYSPEIVAWAQAGGVYAVANIRGGGEEGEQWHRAGMREHKQRCFEDFEAAADRLVAEGLTVPSRLGIWGASNGGLLIGAALTRRPRGYGAAACVAPLLDMARYELSGLGPSWTGEYGTARDPEQLAWLLAYSPYHHVRAGEQYPATLFVVFDGDSRVDPLHARKMCAALQEATAAEAPILYRLERGAGHGARSTSRRTALFADLLAFFAGQLGL